jgi:sugar phosphate isomerase/epimerase
MKIAIHEITTRDGTFAEHLVAYSKTGWRHFEINLWHAGPFLDKVGIKAAARLVADHGLICVAATGLGLRVFAGAGARAENIEQIKRYGEMMQALGCRPLVIGADAPAELTPSNYDQRFQMLAEHVRELAMAATPYGVQLAVEVNWTAMCRSYRTAAKLIERVAQPNVGLVWDPAHFVSTPSRLDDLDLAAGKFVHAHLNDIRDCYFEVIQINADRVIPGQGILPLRQWTEKVRACGYDGFHAVELFNEALWAKPLETICRNVIEGCRAVWPDATF